MDVKRTLREIDRELLKENNSDIIARYLHRSLSLSLPFSPLSLSLSLYHLSWRVNYVKTEELRYREVVV